MIRTPRACHIWEVISKNPNYLLEGGLLQYRLAPLKCVPGTHLYQCASWYCCERLKLGFREFFLKTFSMCLPISWQVIYKHTCPHYAECSAVFDQNGMTPMPHPPQSLDLAPPKWLLFISLDEKNLQKETFYVETKNGRRTLLGININELKNCFEQRKKCLSRCIASNGENFESD